VRAWERMTSALVEVVLRMLLGCVELVRNVASGGESVLKPKIFSLKKKTNNISMPVL
jgi:hypothetical protein